jgi:hypothetical protein
MVNQFIFIALLLLFQYATIVAVSIPNTFKKNSPLPSVLDEESLLTPNFPLREQGRAGGQKMRASSKSTLLQQRIPPTVLPMDYYLRVQPYFLAGTISPGRNMTFDALLSINVRVVAPTNNFTLDAVNLNFTSVSITDIRGNAVDIASDGVTYNADLEHLIIIPNVTLIINATYTLQFTYTGLINSYDMGGLFYTSYLDQNGVQQ